jgi:hypothetical protein
MLIYLDANIVQYCADYEDFLFSDQTDCPVGEPKFRRELHALRQLIHLEQFGNWTFAVSAELLSELRHGRPTRPQREVYKLLQESCWPYDEADASVLRNVAEALQSLQLKDRLDLQHLANAVTLGASWFITNDNDILRKTDGWVRPTRVARPSECVAEISVGLFLTTSFPG